MSLAQVSNQTIDTIKVVETLRDTIIRVERDSSLLRALIECDSIGQAHIKALEEEFSLWNTLHDAGYIFYRTYVGKNGYFLNDDATAVATTDDYHRICLTRVIQKATVICYKTYIDEILDSVQVDADTGQIPTAMCKAFEQYIIKAIQTNMSGEISGFTAYINADQDLITSGALDIQCKIVPTALLKEIDVTLSFNNPSSK